MKRREFRLTSLVVLVISIAPMIYAKQMRPTPQTLTCGSRGNHRAYCAADTRRGAILVQQVSQAPCVQGRSWGFDARGIWVQNGCRAQFQLGQYGSPAWGTLVPVIGRLGHREPEPVSTRTLTIAVITSACGEATNTTIFLRGSTTAFPQLRFLAAPRSTSTAIAISATGIKAPGVTYQT